jgi:hypothetical protein
MATNKVLWVVNYDSMQDFLTQAVGIGATAVAIRSDNDLAKAITAFHAEGMKVYGWRWPSARRDAAMKEAAKIVALFGQGLDGYFVDPEGAPGKPYDWDQKGLDELADDFCSTIKESAAGKRFGVTSHYRANKVFPDLPWASFFKYSDVCLPQAYWKSTEGTIGHGMPADNYAVAIDFWTKAGADKAKIVPMGGELGSSLAGDIDAYVNAAAKQGIDELHFYAAEADVRGAIWNAVARA